MDNYGTSTRANLHHSFLVKSGKYGEGPQAALIPPAPPPALVPPVASQNCDFARRQAALPAEDIDIERELLSEPSPDHVKQAKQDLAQLILDGGAKVDAAIAQQLQAEHEATEMRKQNIELKRQLAMQKRCTSLQRQIPTPLF